jgi:hypothetical protein
MNNKLRLKKCAKGGGDYSTIINGEEVTIEKQYSRGTWVAQTLNGSIDIECETLSQIRGELSRTLNKK